MENKKYYIIKSKDMAMALKIVTGQEPYVYTNKFDGSKMVWSFINDSVFQEAFTTINNLISKNRK